MGTLKKKRNVIRSQRHASPTTRTSSSAALPRSTSKREEDAEAEFESVLEYSDRIATCVVRLELRKNGASQNETTSHEIPAVRTQRTKLPKREFEIMGMSDHAETATDKRVIRDQEANGRYIYEVKLPCKNEVDLADNRAVAEKHFQHLTRRLLKAPNLLEEYDNEMRWLLAEGVAKNAREETHNDGQRIYYIPHQPVLREQYNYEAADRFLAQEANLSMKIWKSDPRGPASHNGHCHGVGGSGRHCSRYECRGSRLPDEDDTKSAITRKHRSLVIDVRLKSGIELEQRKEIGVLTTRFSKEDDLIDLTRFSCASKVERVTGWIFRFLKNIRTKDRTSEPLTAAQIKPALVYWLKRAQSSAFSSKFERNASGGSRISPLKEFQLWTDDNGPLRIPTVLAEVEAVINSRPLTHIHDDPNDGPPLTPASFITGKRLTALPAAEKRELEPDALSLRALWKTRKQMFNAF
ncbi:hypothetical protein HPB50_000170 [Hyalomma asiaticum]|uniref:Uncharacterized protein n=1 Tax=Hyalomma asiaticum TaxID=266040 RepID=A0ACB7TA65_HYAAI|nr:hypothetical protein HPB50_000170 [Hyalomma asiaticum]